MSARIPDTHAEAWALLPWLANGRISPEEREWVEAHLQGCDECRAELAAQRMVASHITRHDTASPSNTSEVQRSFNKLWARIEALESSSSATSPDTAGKLAAPARSSRTVRWLAAAVVVQAIGLGLLGLALNANRDNDSFKTVSVPEARLDAPAVSLVFSPEVSVATINTLLTHQGLSIVAGPGREGNFMAELSADAVASGATAESVAAVMSKDPHVTFAQPIDR
jgi:anti-sigma factor RsiW